MPAAPGLAHQARYRTAFRVLGVVLLVGGAVTCVWGFASFVGADEFPGAGTVVAFMGGFLVAAVGLFFLQAGFMGAAARYGAGETMPVVKDSAEYLSDGEGVLGIGRTSGPFCSRCGVRNDGDARFCDGCGAALA
jgi:zinc ribbon protein